MQKQNLLLFFAAAQIIIKMLAGGKGILKTIRQRILAKLPRLRPQKPQGVTTLSGHWKEVCDG